MIVVGEIVIGVKIVVADILPQVAVQLISARLDDGIDDGPGSVS